MRDISQMLKHAGVVLQRNSPVILTGVAVSGTISTAVLTAKATIQAADEIHQCAIEDLGNDRRPIGVYEAVNHYSLKDKAKMTWKFYIAPVAVGTGTVAAVIALNTVHSRRNAALVGAYTVLEKGFTEYKDKVVETVGEKKEQAVRDSVAQDQVTKNPPSREIVIAEGKVLFYESLTGRYFESTVETVRRAQNDINQQILFENYASKNDWFSELGIPRTADGDDFGWSQTRKIDIQMSAVLTEDGKPAISIGYTFLPEPDYWKVNP